MKYFLTIAFLLTYMAKPEIGYSKTSPLFTHFIYMFGHTDWLHLCINLFSFLSLFNFLNRVIPALPLFLYAYISAVLSSFFSSQSVPTVGASGMVCSLVAIYAILPLLRKKLTVIDKKKYRQWLLLTALALLMPLCSTKINSFNHLFSLIAGAAFAVLDHFLNNQKPNARLR